MRQFKVIQSTWSGNGLGFSVSSAGDFNGDGFDDVIIGAPRTDNDAGAVYVLLGGLKPFSNIDMTSSASSVAIFDSDRFVGFMINGINGSKTGYSVSSAGDFNGDGFSDIIIGAPGANNNAGASYVLYQIPQLAYE